MCKNEKEDFMCVACGIFDSRTAERVRRAWGAESEERLICGFGVMVIKRLRTLWTPWSMRTMRVREKQMG